MIKHFNKILFILIALYVWATFGIMRLNMQQMGLLRVIKDDNEKLNQLSRTLILKINQIYLFHIVISIIIFFVVTYVINKVKNENKK
ncbi:hypothetical protein LNTAR_06244 [Lentisphaera araneosa HTCC2155]|uniref:Uncharacterized protein n=1 Tax=Lentisphaera araneosa HTCC2155 TaxID=313628 RepID=A6DN75_9BACT|nr:hypothetical protein LNTAR_06244 [Lentisphaera araneosa HTCC2155]